MGVYVKNFKLLKGLFFMVLFVSLMFLSVNHIDANSSTVNVYFANKITDSTVRYSTVSIKKEGETNWEYGNYFAPYTDNYGNDKSSCFKLNDGKYDFVLSTSFKNQISFIEGSFDIENGKAVNLISNANSGYEIIEENGEYIIVAGDSVNKVSTNTNAIFF